MSVTASAMIRPRSPTSRIGRSGSGWAKSSRSNPAQNDRPAPVTPTTLTSRWVSNHRAASASSTRCWRDRALSRSGRCSSRRPIGPSTETRTHSNSGGITGNVSIRVSGAPASAHHTLGWLRTLGWVVPSGHARDRQLRRVPALLAAAAGGHRPVARQRRRARARAASPATTRTRRRWASSPAARASPPRPTATSPGLLAFATTAPAYADKTNATAIHAALGLPDDVAGVRRRRRHPLRRRRGVDGPGRRRARRARPTSAPAGRARPTRPTAATPPSRWRSATDGVIAEVVGVGVGQRRVHRPLAHARRAVVAGVGGALRRARLRAARRAGRHGGAEGRAASPSTTSTTSSSPARTPGP